MNTKILSAFLLTAFLIVFSISAVSAITFTPAVASINVAVSNATVLNPTSATNPVIALEESQTVTIGDSINGQTVTFTASPNYAYVETGKVYTGTSNVSNDTGAYQMVTISILQTFCSNGSLNDSDTELGVSIDTDGDDEYEWQPLDTIEIDVNLDNSKDLDGDGDLQDIVFELGLFDADGNDVADDLLWISTDDESFDFGDIDESDEGDHTFEFRVSPELDEGSYTLFVKAYSDGGEDDEFCLDSSSDLDSQYFQEIDISRDNVDDETLISFEDITIDPSTVACGGPVTVSATAYNIGSDEQEAVKIKLASSILGVDKSVVIENFDNDESNLVEFSFNVPANLSEGIYTLSLYALHDYDQDDDEDTEDVEFDDNAFGERTDSEKIDLNVKGNCAGSANASVTAEFSDDTPRAVVGKQVIIEATVKNIGGASTNFSVDVLGNTAWSTVSNIDPKTFTLGAGESKTVKIYMDISEDAEAGSEQEFTIKASYGATSTSQKVKVTLEKSLGFSAIVDHIKNNWVIYTIILVNLILIIAIIIVIVKMASAKN
jgi:hypothetical protein